MNTNTRREQRQRHPPALTPTSRLPTSPPLRPSGSTRRVVSRCARRSYVGPSIIHMHVQQQHFASTIPIPSSIQLNPPPTAYKSCLYQALLVAVCLSPDLDHAPLCYCSRLLRAEREHHRWLKLESSSRIPLRSVTRLRELPIACMNHEYVSPSTHLVGALRNAISVSPAILDRSTQTKSNACLDLDRARQNMNQSTRPKDSTIPPYSAR